MNELGLEVICTNSPQAKGRVERSFKTHQDRLVKENKLLGITTIKEGNIHLKQYSKEHDKYFAVELKCCEDLHQKQNVSNIKRTKNYCINKKFSY